ncbi:MAG: DUF3806 domain-containing protein [Candidatus Rifleibacteriota bacterium]
MAHRINDLNKKENEALSNFVEQGREILEGYGLSKNQYSAKDLDNIFERWAQNHEGEKFNKNQIAEGLGALFGELLTIDFGFGWRMVEDEHGIEPAMVDEKSGSIVFPINSVWKRVEPGVIKQPFFAAMFDAIKNHIENQKGR